VLFRVEAYVNVPEIVLTNQYPVPSSLELRRSDYFSDAPHVLAATWQAEGWMAMENRGLVRAYHGPEAPGPIEDLVASHRLPLQEGRDTLMALNGTLRRGLSKAGYHLRDQNKYTMFAAHDGRTYPSGVKWVQLFRHRTWTWTFEFHEEECWFVPRPTWTKVTELPATEAAAHLGKRFEHAVWTVVNVRTGETWTQLTAQEIQERPWLPSFDFRILYRSRIESDAGPLTVAGIHQAVETEIAFTQIADVTRPRRLQGKAGQVVPTPELTIRKTQITQRKETIQRGLHKKPFRPVKLLVVMPAGDQEARRTLIYRFEEPTRIGEERRLVPAASVIHIWNRKWQLKNHSPISWIKTPVAYDPATGQVMQPEKLAEAAARAVQEDCTLVTVAVLSGRQLSSEAWTTLRAAVRPFNHVFMTQEAYLPKEEPETESRCWSKVTQLALKILRAAGGVPYELKPLPGTTSGTYYLGLDVSSFHHRNRSAVAMVLVSWLGHVVDKRVIPLEENNERIPTYVLTEILPAWLNELSGPREYDRVRRLGTIRPSHLIVHRDGQFMDDEARELQEAFTHLPRLDLVAVKKSPTLRIQSSSKEPRVVPLGERTAGVFSTAALEGRVKPLEVHVVGDTDLVRAAVQVLWLSEMRTDNLYLPGRLPLTTFLADRIASRF